MRINSHAPIEDAKEELVELMRAHGAIGYDPDKEIERVRASTTGVVQTKIERLQGLAGYLPALERQAVADALALMKDGDANEQEWGVKMLDKVVSARVRGVKKARFDRQKRTLVGARVNREFAELCKRAAEEQGVSTTKWCYNALVDALVHHMAKPAAVDDEDDDEVPYLL